MDARSTDRLVARALAVAIVAVTALASGPAVGAQEVPGPPEPPETPGLPDVPQPVDDAIRTVSGELSALAEQGAPVVALAGRPMRPACSSFIAFAVAAPGYGIPVEPLVPLAGPFLVMCDAAYRPGPADPVFDEAEPALVDAYRPVDDAVVEGARTVSPQLAPIRGYLETLCDGAALLVLWEPLGSEPTHVHACNEVT